MLIIIIIIIILAVNYVDYALKFAVYLPRSVHFATSAWLMGSIDCLIPDKLKFSIHESDLSKIVNAAHTQIFIDI